MDTYLPSPDILQKYAQVLVNFALNSGQGVKAGEVVRLIVSESAKPLLVALYKQVITSKAHPIVSYLPDDMDRDFYELATQDQLKFFPKKYMRGVAQEIDHTITIISETDKRELEGINPAKIMTRFKSGKRFKDWLSDKEKAGKYTWTLALYGTSCMAKEAGLSLSEYWDQIIKACFLDQPDPISNWQMVSSENDQIRKELNSLPIDKLHIQGDDADLWISVGSHRAWMGGSGRNIPSFEIFTSPDWRGTTGWIRFNQPLYAFGSRITDIKLEFENGLVTKSYASTNSQLLKKIISVKNANKVGEFSLTDKRFSHINKFMAETLFDENISGPYGNTHIALGASYDDTYSGDLDLNKKEKIQLGFNDSAVHTDIISTTDRTVDAHMENGTMLRIYANGQFTFSPDVK